MPVRRDRGFCNDMRRTCGLVQYLMSKYKSVNDGAWQSCGAVLALIHEGSLETRTVNELCALFRFGPPMAAALA